MRLLKYPLAIFLLLWMGACYCTDIYRVKKSERFLTTTAKFSYEILEHALAATYQSPNDFEIEYQVVDGDELTRQLMLSDAYTDMVDITYGLTRPAWEKELLVVRVPLLKGLMGYRVSFVHRDHIEQFGKLSKLEQFKSLNLGSGNYWAVTAIHQQNGFNTLQASNIPTLLTLLMKKRIDYFPRGVTEILREYSKFKDLHSNLAIEPKFMFHISMPVYLFVNPHRPEVAERLYQGILRIIKNGKYQAIFTKHFGGVSELLNLTERKVFELDNSQLSQESLENLKTFWQQH